MTDFADITARLAELRASKAPTVRAILDALQAVIELHEPEWVPDGIFGGSCCKACGVPVEDEPCDTIQAITTALGGTP